MSVNYIDNNIGINSNYMTGKKRVLGKTPREKSLKGCTMIKKIR